MNPLIRLYGDDGYPSVSFASASGGTFGSNGFVTAFKIGFSGGTFTAENTPPPAESQPAPYGQTMFTATPEFFGGSSTALVDAVTANYQWRIEGTLRVSSVTGATVGTWNAFTAPPKEVQIVLNSGTDSRGYVIEVRRTSSGQVVYSEFFTLDGY